MESQPKMLNSGLILKTFTHVLHCYHTDKCIRRYAGIFGKKNIIIFENYNLTPLDMYEWTVLRLT